MYHDQLSFKYYSIKAQLCGIDSTNCTDLMAKLTSMGKLTVVKRSDSGPDDLLRSK